MIQDLRPGDLIAEIPGRGPLVRELPTLRALFADLLAQGSVVELGGARRIDWRVDGMLPVRASDPRVRAAADRLGVSITAARACSERFAALLRERPSASEIVVPAELLKELSGSDRGEVRLQRRQVEFLRDLTRQSAEAVDEAVGRGDFVGDSRHVLLIGWGTLPPPERRGLHRKPIEASLELKGSGALAGAAPTSWSLAWSVCGPATAVELFAVAPTGGGSSAVPGTRRVFVETPTAGEWSVPCDAITPGTFVQAVAAGASGVARSSPVQLGTAPAIEQAPIPAETDLGSDDPPIVELPAARGLSRNRVLAAASLLLLLSASIGTYVAVRLNPPMPTFARAEMLFVAPALPPTPRPLEVRSAWSLGEPGLPPRDVARSEPSDAERSPSGLNGLANGASIGGPERADEKSRGPALTAERRIQSFKVGEADRIATDPPLLPFRPEFPQFRVGAPNFVAFDDLQKHAGDPDAKLWLPAESKELAAAADKGLTVLMGIEVKAASKDVLDWARASGLRVVMVPDGDRALLLADSPRPFQGPAEVRDRAVKMSWGDSWIQTWGIETRPVVAIESAGDAVRCAGTLDGAPGVRLERNLVLEGNLVAWPLIVDAGGEIKVRFLARECNVETHEFRFRTVRPRAAQ
jgi:hypothetical protein